MKLYTSHKHEFNGNFSRENVYGGVPIYDDTWGEEIIGYEQGLINQWIYEGLDPRIVEPRATKDFSIEELSAIGMVGVELLQLDQ